ncbi:baseplate J/gp47 family protein [Zoogloea sp.]|uniref:baseplate J/gp47 family protein n=2 Tax=Zoogloea sp. TaxID=49181 RepID=UPI0035B3171D
MALERVYRKKDFAEVVDALLTDIGSGMGGRIALTDANEGSVVRTLAEAFARELAVCYEQLDVVYRNAYLETANGAALDKVVALLGMERQRGGHLEGTVVFGRGQPAPEDIHIPQGTLVAGRNMPLCATTAPSTLDKGERHVSVGLRALDPGGETIRAGALNILPRPIAGIDSVTNPGDLVVRQREETDDELRTRARQLVLSSNTGTVAALEQAVRSLGIREVQVIENPDERPGEVEVVLGDRDIPAELLELVHNRLEDVRPAGIILNCGPATPVFVQITADLVLNAGLGDKEAQDLQQHLAALLADYFGKLKVGEPLRAAKLRALLLSHDAVVDCEASGTQPLLTPHVFGSSGQFESLIYRCLQSNGDLLLRRNERFALYPEALPLRLSLVPPKLNVWVDVNLTLKPDTNRPSDERVTAAVKTVLEQTLKAAKPDAPASLGYATLQAAVAALVPAGSISRLRFTVVHDADGLVDELDRADTQSTLSTREQALTRRISVVVESSHG